MTLNLAISNALSGLRVAQRSLDTVSHNIANVQTDGYTRKTKAQESVIIGGNGAGVRDQEVQRTVDRALQRELWRQRGNVEALETQETYMRRIEELSGRPEDEGSIAALLSELREGFEAMTVTPESQTLQLDTITKAETLTRALNRMSDALLRVRNDVQVELDRSLDDLNSVVQRLAPLNDAVVSATQTGRSPADLEDQRDTAMQELAELVDITYGFGADNRLVVLTRPGLTLVDKQAVEFHFTPANLGHSSFYRFGSNSDVNPIRLSDPIAGVDVTPQLQGGKIGTLLELRDRTIPTLQAQVDEFAHKLALRFQSAGMTLFTGTDGVSIPPDQIAGYVGFASTIRVASAVDDPAFVRYGDSGVPTTPPSNVVSNGVVERVLNFTFGDTANAAGTAHAAFRTSFLGPDPTVNLTSTLPASGRIEDFVRSLITDQGQRRSNISRELKDSTTLRDATQARFSGESGVNLDQELAQLTILQRAYGASAQILRTSQSLLDDLFSAVR